MDLIEKIKSIEKYVCEYFEDLDLDDPVEEGRFAEYEEVQGATAKEIHDFENHFNIVLPKDLKEIYTYKNGSRFFPLLPAFIDNRDYSFTLLSLEEIKHLKEYFQNKNALFTDFPDYFSKEEIKRQADPRLQPYLFHKKRIPFAQYCDSCYLMLDFIPGNLGQAGQILCYVHDPDEVLYVCPDITSLIDDIRENIITTS
ncbi:SMI1/KNR4 family protein [Anaeroglobus sp. AF13-6AC]|uniref:SMI1/KNR4 family protein n=1 Tax=Anaeroglobus sp. AF13-6AC TaxID=2997918 RepID=UPI0022E084E1|nr:SMI1/KNR4 family protein [Anaeroglobus sp. AF13-6AC]